MRVKEYMALLLILEAGVMGVFLSLDLLSLLPLLGSRAGSHVPADRYLGQRDHQAWCAGTYLLGLEILAVYILR